MNTRTRSRWVRFARPFALRGLDRMLPAGRYEVETDEALVEGLSLVVWRRTLTVIHLGALPGRPGTTESLAIDPADLDAALAHDGAAVAAPLADPAEGSTT